MRTIVADNGEAFSQLGADFIAGFLAERPDASLLVATGNTPMGIYEELARRYQDGDLDTSQARVFQLDEYLGLDEDDFRSLYGWTKRSFVDPLGISSERVTRLIADDGDPEGACLRYDADIDAVGGIDLAILGLGPNGHLGFNEPPSSADAPTRVVSLPEASLESNAVYWGGRDQVPLQAMTAGMNVILAARQILLVAAGARKQKILQQTMAGPMTPDVPSSWLQGAANVTILTDRAALPSREGGSS